MDMPEAFKEIREKLHSIDITLTKQHMTLEDHTRRSLANEKAVDLLAAELKPIRAHVNRMEGGLKLLGVISIISGIVFTIIRAITSF
jgi:hypothetical protein